MIKEFECQHCLDKMEVSGDLGLCYTCGSQVEFEYNPFGELIAVFSECDRCTMPLRVDEFGVSCESCGLKAKLWVNTSRDKNHHLHNTKGQALVAFTLGE